MVTGGRKIKFSDKKSARLVLNFVSDRVQPTAGASARVSALACRQSADRVQTVCILKVMLSTLLKQLIYNDLCAISAECRQKCFLQFLLLYGETSNKNNVDILFIADYFVSLYISSPHTIFISLTFEVKHLFRNSTIQLL